MPKRPKRHIILDDGSLLEALRNESTREDAFRVLYTGNNSTLQKVAYFITEDLNASKDIVQDVFMSFWIDAPFMNTEIGNLSSYLSGMTKNHALRYIETRKRRRLLSKAFANEMSTEEKPGIYRDDALRMIAGLPEQQRRAFYQFVIKDKSVEEVAAILNVGPETVYQYIYRAKQTLKAVWQVLKT